MWQGHKKTLTFWCKWFILLLPHQGMILDSRNGSQKRESDKQY